jgi:cytidylate kinase
MNHLKMLHQYLKEKRRLEDIPATGYPFITISREAGAGGHLLAHVLTTDFLKYAGEDLFEGWHVFDRELCEVIAEDPALQMSMEELLAERYRSEMSEFLDGLFSGRSNQYLQYKRTFQVVRMLATLGKVIIVGRAANLVTAAIPGGIRVRIVASEPARVAWMMRKLKVDKGEARRLVAKQDSDRRKVVRCFFDKDIADPLLYDVIWNSEEVDPHEMSYSLIEMLKFRAAVKKRAGLAGRKLRAIS